LIVEKRFRIRHRSAGLSTGDAIPRQGNFRSGTPDGILKTALENI
jgi:hypothetical protein